MIKVEFPFYGKEGTLKEVRYNKNNIIIKNYGVKRNKYKTSIIDNSYLNNEYLKRRIEKTTKEIGELPGNCEFVKRMDQIDIFYPEYNYSIIKIFHKLGFCGCAIMIALALKNITSLNACLFLGGAVLTSFIPLFTGMSLEDKKDYEMYHKVLKDYEEMKEYEEKKKQRTSNKTQVDNTQYTHINSKIESASKNESIKIKTLDK